VPFGGEADPYTTLPGVGPPWYLLAPFGLLELTPQAIPRQIPGAILLLAAVAFLALPFLHSSDSSPSPRGRRLLLGGGVLVLVVWFLLSLYGARVV
jgi:quinol-cytochrome oxidoreductase complex cytochrome b subunit